MTEKRELPDSVREQRESLFVAVNEQFELQQKRAKSVLRSFCVAATVLVFAVGLTFALANSNKTPEPVAKGPESVNSDGVTAGMPKTDFVSFEYLTDDELLALLDELGEPSALGSIGDRVVVVRQ